MSTADSPVGVQRGADLVLLDVRSEHEWTAGHIGNAVHIPVGAVAVRAKEFAPRASVVTICEGGYRSMLAASLLSRAGLSNILNVTGGMAACRSSEAEHVG
jgi:hydroxyacylglutathione hydrolase